MTVKVCQCNGSAVSVDGDEMTEEERRSAREIIEAYKKVLNMLITNKVK